MSGNPIEYRGRLIYPHLGSDPTYDGWDAWQKMSLPKTCPICGTMACRTHTDGNFILDKYIDKLNNNEDIEGFVTYGGDI